MRTLLAILFIFAAALVYCRAEVKEVYKPQVPTLGKPISPPIRMMPPVDLRPNPPTPEEIAAAQAAKEIRAKFKAALNALLEKAGVTNQTDLAALSNATARMQAAQVETTNQTTKITIGDKP